MTDFYFNVKLYVMWLFCSIFFPQTTIYLVLFCFIRSYLIKCKVGFHCETVFLIITSDVLFRYD